MCKIVTPLFAFCKQSVVCDVQQAEALIAQGMLKRATAMTNSNSQSRCVHYVYMWYGIIICLTIKTFIKVL